MQKVAMEKSGEGEKKGGRGLGVQWTPCYPDTCVHSTSLGYPDK